MPPEDSHSIDDKLGALKELMEEKFSRVFEKLDELSSNMVGLARFDAWCARVVKLEAKQDNHDMRLDKLERVNYLLNIIGKVAIGVLIALLIAVVTGKLKIIGG